MEKDIKTEGFTSLMAMFEECADLILLHSNERVLWATWPLEPAHKAYIALALAALEAIRAFVALDESMK